MFGKFFSRLVSSQDIAAEPEAQEFKYCPSCGDEFRSEFMRCSGCDCDLESGSAGDYRSDGENHGSSVMVVESIRPGESDLVGVTQGGLLDLKRVRNLLKARGIASLIVGEGPDSLKSCCGGSKSFVIKVRENDRLAAAQILSSDFRSSTDLEAHDSTDQSGSVFDERVVSKCPACGHSFAPVDPVCPECGLCF